MWGDGIKNGATVGCTIVPPLEYKITQISACNAGELNSFSAGLDENEWLQNRDSCRKLNVTHSGENNDYIFHEGFALMG